MNSSPLTKDVWKCDSSPLFINSRERHFTPVSHQQQLSSPEMSPVIDELPNPTTKSGSFMTCKKILHNFFHGNTRETLAQQKKEVVNSTVITASDMDSSSQPASQDTGYHTEESVS